MKKWFALLMAALLVLSLAACGGKKEESKPESETEKQTEAQTEAQTEKPSESEAEPEMAVMSHAEYAAAEVDDPVLVEVYVQAHQSWWDNKITVYAADEEGAYFIYEMACSEEDAAKLDPGTKIRVKGYKGEWSGEVEIVDATFEILEDSYYYAAPTDLTDFLGTDKLIEFQNEFAAFHDMIVEPMNDEGAAFLYKWDGSGAEGDDLYFKVSTNGASYSFTVESYLCGPDTDVYKAVKALKPGDLVDMEGFLYWYEGPNPHITSVTVNAPMTQAEYQAAAVDDPVFVETYVQAHQSWWEDKVTVYAANEDGACFIYEMPCSQEDSEKLVPGTKIRVKGYKGEWSGEVEIVDSSFWFVNDGSSFIAEPADVTDLLGKDELADHMNELVSFKGMTVEAMNDEGAAYLYKWDGSGSEGDDLYFKVSKDGASYSFTVESYLCGADTDVYKAVKELKVGDTIDLEGFLYWYEGANPHITAVSPAK